MSVNWPLDVHRFDVAVQALAVIARSDGACPSAVIAADLASHAAFLRRVLAQLARAGIVVVREGRAGGYRLARPPEEVSLLDVFYAVRLTDGVAAPVDEGADAPDCVRTALNSVAGEAGQAVTETLRRHSLGSVMAQPETTAFVGLSAAAPPPARRRPRPR